MTPHDAAELFEQGRSAMRNLRIIRAHRERLRSGLPAGSIPTATSGGGVSNPTQRAANELLDLDEDWSAREEQLSRQVKEVRALCRGVGLAFGPNLGPEYALILEDRYLLDMEWKQVAAVMGRSITYLKTVKSDACKYIARVGVAAAKQGLKGIKR